MKKIFILIIVFLSAPLVVLAHPGNTDSYGCHTCYTNCIDWGLYDGQYHCHNNSKLPQGVNFKCHLTGCSEPIAYCDQEQLVDIKALNFKLGRNDTYYEQKALDDCNNKIEDYKNKLEIYNTCLINDKKQLNECEEQQRQNDKQTNALTLDYYCSRIHNALSFYSETAKTCLCQDGYTISNDECVSYTHACIDTYGINVYGIKLNETQANCICNDGYEMVSSKLSNSKACLKKNEPIAITPTPFYDLKTSTTLKTTPEPTIKLTTDDKKINGVLPSDTKITTTKQTVNKTINQNYTPDKVNSKTTEESKTPILYGQINTKSGTDSVDLASSKVSNPVLKPGIVSRAINWFRNLFAIIPFKEIR